jgi:LytS/YehU family sensor histidine kinase
MTLTKISFIVGGALFGGIITFFVAGFLLRAILGGPIPAGLLGNAFLAFSFIVAPFIGGYVGYLVFKRSKYSNPDLYFA